MFENVGQVTKALAGQQYIATDEIVTVMFLASRLGKPLLAEGPAGVGKTELAKAWVGAAGMQLIRLQCYEGLDESKALYEWEYARQMLYTQLLRDKLSQIPSDAETLTGAAAAANPDSARGSARRDLPSAAASGLCDMAAYNCTCRSPR